MKRTFTKYPSNKVYATKAYTKGYVVSDPILVSSNGNFKLVIEGGIGIQDTPYTDFQVRCSRVAQNAVVSIDISRGWGSFSGMPVIGIPDKYRDGSYADVNYGFGSERTGNDWIRDTFIPIMEEALQFCDEINNFFASTSREELSEMSKDVFLDMGIDYDSYIQQEADSYL